MKTTGICPNCCQKDVMEVPGRVGPYHTGNNIQAGFTVFGHVQVDRYLCGACGSSEEWVGDAADLERLRKKSGRA